MANSETAPTSQGQEEKAVRGKNRGRSFFALRRKTWDALWSVKTSNRINLVMTYLVLLAGTGSDHRLTKWSAKACEQHLGMGKPRARAAIDELIAAGLARTTEQSTQMAPQYELGELPRDEKPIFLPVALVTGLAGETPILRRVKETGDEGLLRMLIDLYGLVEVDATHGVSIVHLRFGGVNDVPAARRISSIGANALWAVETGTWRSGSGDWVSTHAIEGKKNAPTDWSKFWERVDTLKKIGAIHFEPWIFDSDRVDAEPLIPLDPSASYNLAEPTDEAKLTSLLQAAAYALVGEERAYLFDKSDADYFVPLPDHHQMPAYREVAKMTVEADTPGRRLAWRRRQELIEQRTAAYTQLIEDARHARFDRPIRLGLREAER
jgi:hypothetical protein